MIYLLTYSVTIDFLHILSTLLILKWNNVKQ